MMCSTVKRRFLAAVIMVTALFAVGQPASAMTVQPVVLDLQSSGRGMTQVITVQNTFSTPLPVEMRVEQLNVDNNGFTGTGHDPGDLLVFPPQALIQPGQTQTFRVQWVGNPQLAKSQHYYVTVAQLPVQLPTGQSAIQILYNFQVLVSVSPPGAEPNLKIAGAEIGKNADGKPIPVITVSDDSAAHGYLSHGRLRITEKDTSGKDVFNKVLTGPEIQQIAGFGLVAAGQTRHISIPVVLPVEGGSLEVQFTPDSTR